MKGLPDAFGRRAAALLGDRYSATMEERLSHSFDATNQRFLPDAVAYPKNTAEIADLLALATEFGVPVVPRGAGAGFSGGAVSVAGGLSLVVTGMNRILSIDAANFTVEVEPGVITAELQRAVEGRGLFYPPDPASQEFCTIGGNIAENAGGMRAVKYGVTREYVRALEAVLPTGEIIHTGARAAKSVVGYDLTRLLVGSEGTLAVITRAMLRLLPKPRSVITLAARFASIGAACEAVSRIMACGVIPRTLEFLDRSALTAVEEALHEKTASACGAALLIETDGNPESAAFEMNEIERVLAALGDVETERASDPEAAERLWRIRRSVSPAIHRLAKRKINEDVAVPIAAIPGFMARVDAISKQTSVRIVCFGHAGDGNIHVNLLFDPAEPGIGPRVETALDAVLTASLDLGGTLSGEHGIGFLKSRFIEREVEPHTLALMRKIKRVFDPMGILNPGKIFP